jgi:hypothetical protein
LRQLTGFSDEITDLKSQQATIKKSEKATAAFNIFQKPSMDNDDLKTATIELNGKYITDRKFHCFWFL